MSIRKTPLLEGEYYHIYNRGNSKQKIFLDDEDYEYFIKCLYCCNTHKNFKFRNDIVYKNIYAFDFERENTLVSIGAWVLMPNHFHVYITSTHKSDLCVDRENHISDFMRKVSTAYAKYFNNKYQRTGGLFEGKFKSVHIKTDHQAKYLFSYIHLNPLKLIFPKWKESGVKDMKKAVIFLLKYKWSSYIDYVDNSRSENKILDIHAFPKYFLNIIDFKKETFGWFKYDEEIKS